LLCAIQCILLCVLSCLAFSYGMSVRDHMGSVWLCGLCMCYKHLPASAPNQQCPGRGVPMHIGCMSCRLCWVQATHVGNCLASRHGTAVNCSRACTPCTSPDSKPLAAWLVVWIGSCADCAAAVALAQTHAGATSISCEGLGRSGAADCMSDGPGCTGRCWCGVWFLEACRPRQGCTFANSLYTRQQQFGICSRLSTRFQQNLHSGRAAAHPRVCAGSFRCSFAACGFCVVFGCLVRCKSCSVVGALPRPL
jgi:hypothetical protein